jgi:hypothetical protein
MTLSTPLEQKVTSLELSKQLYEAGIVVNSEFWWDAKRNIIISGKPEWVNEVTTCIPAPLSSELGELLPERYHTWKGLPEGLSEGDKWWCVQFSEPEFEADNFEFSADTEADARAKMLLFLKEKGLI